MKKAKKATARKSTVAVHRPTSRVRAAIRNASQEANRPVSKDEQKTMSLVVTMVDAVTAYMRDYYMRDYQRKLTAGSMAELERDAHLFKACCRVAGGASGLGVSLAKDIDEMVEREANQ